MRNFGLQRFSNPYNGAKREARAEKIVFLFALISAIFLVPEEKSSCRLRGSGLRWVFPAKAPRVQNWGLLLLLSFWLFLLAFIFWLTATAFCRCTLHFCCMFMRYAFFLRLTLTLAPQNTHTHRQAHRLTHTYSFRHALLSLLLLLGLSCPPCCFILAHLRHNGISFRYFFPFLRLSFSARAFDFSSCCRNSHCVCLGKFILGPRLP